MRSLKYLAPAAAMLLLASLAAGQSPQSTPAPAKAPVSPAADWRFADPGAQLIGGMDVHGLLNSTLVQSALDEAAAKIGDGALPMRMTLAALSGVAQVYFSITARKDDAETLLLIKGTVDDSAARAFLQGASPSGASQAGGKPKMEMTRIDADTILLGSPALLDPAVRRMQRPMPAVPNPLFARAKTLAAGNDFWIGGTLPDVPATALIGGGIKRLALGLSLQSDVRIQLSFDMATVEMAKQMAAQVQKSAGDALRTQAGLDTKVETSISGTTVSISSSMDGSQVLKVLADKLQGGVPPGSLLGGDLTRPTPAQTVSEPVPQQPKTVRILGLDDGPREVPFPSGQR